jgi:ADP-heptose:LPS heptosyltransferase
LAPDAEVVAFVHPGSGGSALDWEPERFAGVANALASQPGWRVFLTGAGRDRKMVERVRRCIDPGIVDLLDRYPLREFLGVIGSGDLMVAPSTGPLHLASALDLAAVGLYPPVATMSPVRWGPRGRWCTALLPQLTCPQKRVCTLERCRHYNCLAAIYEKDVIAAAVRLVARRQTESSAP